MPDDQPAPEQRQTFFAELKKRKVFRVGATYAVVTWIIVQIASATFTSFGIPEWAFRLVVLVLALGFPVALVLAWAFELTPSGVRLTKSVAADTRAPGSESRRKWFAIGLAAALPTVIFGTLALVFYIGRADRGAGEAARSDIGSSYHLGSVAVLPFHVISGDEPLQLMAVGLQEELLSQFSSMDPLSVVSRTSTLRYRDPGQSLRDIGSELGADYVVEGSIRKSGARWRLTLQPIEASTDLHLASLDYDFDSTIEDTLLFQKETAWLAAIDIYQAIRQYRPPPAAAAGRHDVQVAALVADMQKTEGEFWGDDAKARNPEVLPELLDKTRLIMRVDPDNAVAHRKYLIFKYQDGRQAASDMTLWMREVTLSVSRALRLDPGHFETQLQTGAFYLYSRQRPDLALPYLQKGMTLYEKESGGAYNWPYYLLSRAMLLTGNASAALNVLDRAPNSPAFAELDAWTEAYEFSRRFEEGIGFLENQLARAVRENNAQAELDLSGKIANFETWWSGSPGPLRSHYERIKDNPLATPAMKSMLLMGLQRYDDALAAMSSVEPGADPYAANNVVFMSFRAYALRESGNRPLAQSYLQKSIKSLEENEYFVGTMPGNAYATLALFHALAGDKEASMAAARKSESSLDASRNLPLYYFNIGLLARAYLEAGEIDKACAKLEQMLSGPTGPSAGRILMEFRDPALFQDARFQTVIRGHADQLKDAALLDEYFAKRG